MRKAEVWVRTGHKSSSIPSCEEENLFTTTWILALLLKNHMTVLGESLFVMYDVNVQSEQCDF